MNIIENLQETVCKEKILLHGSPKYCYELRPADFGMGNVLCTTQFATIAVMMAILRACPVKGQVKYQPLKNPTDDHIILKLTKEKLQSLMNHPNLEGYVYVLGRDGFKPRFFNEFRSGESRFVRKPIRVERSDLPFTPTEGQLEYKICTDPEIHRQFSTREFFP